jgi:type IV secretory pathway TraG/TraD family ATPase VirD4
VLLFDPTNADSAAYNPLLEVRRGEWEVVDPEGALERPTADRRAGIETPRPSAPARAR